MATSTSSVSERSKKSEILDAYNGLLKKLESAPSQQASLPMQSDEKEKENRMREETSKISEDKIRKEGDLFDKKINETMAALAEKLLTEHGEVEKMLIDALGKLQNVRDLIVVEEKKLKNIYGLKTTCISLADFLRLIEQEKLKWETEKQEQKALRQREEDEYGYLLQKKRKQEEDEYLWKQKQIKAEFDADMTRQKEEITKKETELKTQESELADLRKLKIGFEAEKEKAVKFALETQAKEMKKEHDTTTLLNAQKSEAEKKLLQQQLSHFESLVSQKEVELRATKKEAEEARNKSQELALSIVESQKSEVQVMEKASCP